MGAYESRACMQGAAPLILSLGAAALPGTLYSPDQGPSAQAMAEAAQHSTWEASQQQEQPSQMKLQSPGGETTHTTREAHP